MSARAISMPEWEFAKLMDERYGHFTEEDWARLDAKIEADPEFQAWRCAQKISP